MRQGMQEPPEAGRGRNRFFLEPQRTGPLLIS